jgi:hypothetical protein
MEKSLWAQGYFLMEVGPPGDVGRLSAILVFLTSIFLGIPMLSVVTAVGTVR